MTRSEQEQALAKGLGFECDPDRERGRGWCKFRKGAWVVWETPHNGLIAWGVAKLVDERYTQHSYYLALEQALRAVPAAE